MTLDLTPYVIAEDKPYSNLSIKLVMPTKCDMNCPFCFNKYTNDTSVREIPNFLNNYIASIVTIIDNAGDRPVSLDITGNEPTYDQWLFDEVMDGVASLRAMTRPGGKPYIDKLVVTTNGYHLTPHIIRKMGGVVDYVNISVHHYNDNYRALAFGMSHNIISSVNYRMFNRTFHKVGIKVSCVGVIYERWHYIYGLYSQYYVRKFAEWAKACGFDSLRLRSDFMNESDRGIFDEFFDYPILEGETVKVKGLTYKEASFEGFPVTLLKGVPSLVPYVVGAEAVVDDDGLPYLDYAKEYPYRPEYYKHVYISKD